MIICSGENDDDSSLGKYYEALVRNVKTKYPKAEIISILQSSQKTYTDKIKTIQTIAKHYNIPTADTIIPFTNGENGPYSSLTVDDIHPSNKGYAIYTKVLENLIATNILKNQASHIFKWRKLPNPIFPDSLDHAYFQAFSTNVLARTENTFTGKINFPKGSFLGMDIWYFRGLNSCKLVINDKPITSQKINWGHDNKHFITELKKIDATGESQVTITFGTKEQADNFKELFVTCPKSKHNIFFSFTSLSKNTIVILLINKITCVIVSLIVGIIASYLFSKYKEFKERSQRLKNEQELLNPLIEIAIKLSEKLYYFICENKKNYPKSLKIKEMFEMLEFPTSYLPDCITCERALIQIHFLYIEAKRIRNLERNLIRNKYLDQVIKIIEVYEEHLQNSFDLLRQFKDTKEKYKCDINYDEVKNEISRNPYMRLNTAMNSFISSIAHLFKSDSIFETISNQTIILDEEYYNRMEMRCKSCPCYCKPENFKITNDGNEIFMQE